MFKELIAGELAEQLLAKKIAPATEALVEALRIGKVHSISFSEMSTGRQLVVDHKNERMFLSVTRACFSCTACCSRIDMAIRAGCEVYSAPLDNRRWVELQYVEVIDLDSLKAISIPFTVTGVS